MKATHGWWRWWRLLVMVMMGVMGVMAVTSERAKLHDRQSLLLRTERLLDKLEGLLERTHIRDQKEQVSTDYSSPEAGRRWMDRANKELLYWKHRMALAEWDFVTNITDYTQNQYMSLVDQGSQWAKPMTAEGRKFKVENFDPDLQRQFQMVTLSSDPKDPAKTGQLSQLHTSMMTTYDTAKVCLPSPRGQHQHQPQQHQRRDTKSNGCLPLEPDLQDKMAESRDPAELLEVWKGWREVAGKPQRQRYEQYVQLLNQGAKDNDFADYSQYWTQDQFPDDTPLEAMTSELWRQLRPLYLELHAYVRGGLQRRYGAATVGTDGTIPAHLLGNMWAQTWFNIFSLVTPFPDVSQTSGHVDDALKKRYDVRGLFELSDKFYVSMGFPPMTQTFWNQSMMEKPPDREVQCHASAQDMYSPGDFRIKMCSSVTSEYLSTIHHEMGHVQYFMAYESQPTVYRDSANQAFHEAAGDTTALAVMSRTHLKKLGLAVPNGALDQHEQDINDLMKMALTKIAFLPFALVVDRWRWQVFRGQTTPETYNKDWWKLRLELQGLRSPVPRSEEDFDPAAKMHVVDNSPYYCYFVSHVVQFQFFQTLCKASGHHGPLHLCDFEGSVTAGTRFRKFMAAGASRPWQDVLEEFTGSREVTAQPMLDYFEPLHQWLRDKNKENQDTGGWDHATVNWRHQL